MFCLIATHAYDMKRACLFLGALLLGSGLTLAQAPAAKPEAWPSKNIRLVVPYAAGGPADLVARELAQVLAADLKQAVTVENMGGAMGVNALGVAARAEPDGHTWVMPAVGNVVLQPMLSKHGGADLIAKLKPAGPVSTAPHVLVVSSKLPVKSLQELVDYAKANPGKVSFASAGTGGTAHLGMEMFKLISGADVLHVPYKGSSGAFNDLASGQVSAMFSSLPSLQGLADKGLVRILAATAPSTSPATKSLPLMASVLPGFDYATWYAVYVPQATPAPLVERINAALNRALKNPKLADKVQAAGTELFAGTPDEVLRWTERDAEKWKRVIQTARISVD